MRIRDVKMRRCCRKKSPAGGLTGILTIPMKILTENKSWSGVFQALTIVIFKCRIEICLM